MKKILTLLFLFPMMLLSQGIMGDKTEFNRQTHLEDLLLKRDYGGT